MLVPNFIFSSIFEITPQFLERQGITALVLDVDNTLRLHGEKDPFEGILDWCVLMKESGIKLTISSNNFKKSVSKFAEKLDLDYVAMSCKPFPLGLSRAVKKFGISKKKIAIVGDQIFTDVIGGNIEGVMTILVNPLKQEKGFLWTLKRHVEKPFINRYYKKNKTKKDE